MPKREETSKVRVIPLDVWVHTARVPGGAHAGSVAKSSCLIFPRGRLVEKKGQRWSEDTGQPARPVSSLLQTKQGFLREGKNRLIDV